MKLRTILGVAAVLVATAMPAIGSAQRYRSNRNSYGGYGRGPFYPSWTPGVSGRYVGSGVPIRSGGATIYFGPGGGYSGTLPYSYYGYAPYGYYGPTYYSYPSYGYSNYGNRYHPGNRLYRRHR